MSERANGSAEAGLGRRLRRFQERFEPLVTRVLLLGIFATGLTAQFIKPVGDALEGKAYLGGALLASSDTSCTTRSRSCPHRSGRRLALW
ncbi:hypothetical protein [Streptomyces sp. HUCO-GS316]|uniref:hypothetical protein n=1 Tax=Streptomyces sp. HUCO-GS316 TaxID=2692198 RepID=UPI001F328B21|nr:hypothetical protein [Streptomyces sp. HUCO-GS316]